MEIELILHQRLSKAQIRVCLEWCLESSYNKGRLLEWALSENEKLSNNALWIMAHLAETETIWIHGHRDKLINRLLQCETVTKRRLLLSILRRLPYSPDEIRSDLLDYCLSKINSECEPYAIRCYSLYLSFKLCRHYPELTEELEQHLEILSHQTLSPGLKSALRQTDKRIRQLKKRARGC